MYSKFYLKDRNSECLCWILHNSKHIEIKICFALSKKRKKEKKFFVLKYVYNLNLKYWDRSLGLVVSTLLFVSKLIIATLSSNSLYNLSKNIHLLPHKSYKFRQV